MSSISIDNLIKRPTEPKVKFTLTVQAQKIMLLYMTLEFLLLLCVLYLVRVKIPNKNKTPKTPNDILTKLSTVVALEPDQKIWIYNISRAAYTEYVVTELLTLKPLDTVSNRALRKDEYWDIKEQAWKRLKLTHGAPRVDNDRHIISRDNNYSYLRLGQLYQYDNIRRKLTLRASKEFPLNPSTGDVLPWTYRRYSTFLGNSQIEIDNQLNPDKVHDRAYFLYDVSKKWTLKLCAASEYFDNGWCVKKLNTDAIVTVVADEPLTPTPPSSASRKQPKKSRHTVVFYYSHYEIFVWLTANQQTLVIDDLPICGYDNVRKSMSIKFSDRQKTGTLFQRKDATAFNGKYLADLENAHKVYTREGGELNFDLPVVVVGDEILSMNSAVHKLIQGAKIVEEAALPPPEKIQQNEIIMKPKFQERILTLETDETKLEIHIVAVGSIYFSLVSNEHLELHLPAQNEEIDKYFSISHNIEDKIKDHTQHYTTSSIYTEKVQL